MAVPFRQVFVAMGGLHRIKNIFAIVSGLISLTASANEAFADASRDLLGRISALGRAHEFVRPHSEASRPQAGDVTLYTLLETIGTKLSEVTANIAEGVQSLFGDPVASRITIVPIKPKSQAAILATTAKTSAGLKAEPSMDGLISVCAFFTDDNRMVTRSIFKDMASLKGSGEAQMRVMGGMKEHMAGKPTPLMGQIFWHLKQ